MTPKIKYGVSNLIMWGYNGRVLYPFVLFRADQKGVGDQLFRHELEHVYQVNRMGWWRFHLSYVWLLIRHGYKNHPYEIDARAHEDEDLTTVERGWKDA